MIQTSYYIQRKFIVWRFPECSTSAITCECTPWSMKYRLGLRDNKSDSLGLRSTKMTCLGSQWSCFRNCYWQVIWTEVYNHEVYKTIDYATKENCTSFDPCWVHISFSIKMRCLLMHWWYSQQWLFKCLNFSRLLRAGNPGRNSILKMKLPFHIICHRNKTIVAEYNRTTILILRECLMLLIECFYRSKNNFCWEWEYELNFQQDVLKRLSFVCNLSTKRPSYIDLQVLKYLSTDTWYS